MNLEQIKLRMGALAAELVTLQNAIGDLQGNIAVAIPAPIVVKSAMDSLEPGDLVACVANTSKAPVRRRCITVGKVYRVERQLDGFDGVRITQDDEGDGHDAIDVEFVKVKKVEHWREVHVGDEVAVGISFRFHGCREYNEPGVYAVEAVEDSYYTGSFPISFAGGWIRCGDDEYLQSDNLKGHLFKVIK